MITKKFIDQRIAKHRKEIRKQKDLKVPKTRHPAWKQLQGRIKELEYLKQFAEEDEDDDFDEDFQ